MAPKNILPRKKIADFIDNLYDGDLHRAPDTHRGDNPKSYVPLIVVTYRHGEHE